MTSRTVKKSIGGSKAITPRSREKTRLRAVSAKSQASLPADVATEWAKLVLSGAVVAGPHVRNACRRHLQDLKDGPGRGLVWDIRAAVRAINFFRDVLRLNGGQFEGKPFELHPSQAFRVGSLFGWKKADGTRRFRRFYDEEGKGNGKSPLLAGIGLYCLMADGESRAEVYSAASKKDQAMILFRDAVAMVDQSPALSKRIRKSGTAPTWNLADFRTGSWFRPISSEDGQSGPRPSCALIDEVHEHKNSTVVEMLERGFKFRRQPILCMATNSGSDRNSVCWQEHVHATRVAAGTRTPDEAFTYVGEVIDDETFAFVCSLDPGDEPLTDKSCWIKTNPLLGVIVQEKYLESVVKQAKDIPGKLNGILRLHFCVWTDADTAWMSRPTLESVLARFDPAEHYGEDIAIGIDLAATQDMTVVAFVCRTGTVHRRRENGEVIELPTFDAWVEAWTPFDTVAARSLKDQAPYDVWVEQGWLNGAPGKAVRPDFIAARIAEACSEYSVLSIGYDAYAFRKNFEPELDAAGVSAPLVEHPQGGKRRAADSGLWMPGSLKALEELILDKRIRLLNSPVLVSAMMGAAIEADAFDNRWLSKRKATVRIDPAVALAIAVGVVLSFSVETSFVTEKVMVI